MDAEILTPRLRMRPLRLEDAEELLAIRSCEEVSQQIIGAETWTSITEAGSWIYTVVNQPGSLIYAVSLKDTIPEQKVEVVGVLGISKWDKLHYVFHPDFWGRGYCTEALRAYLPVLFERQPERGHLVAAVLESNMASRKVLEKCDFRKDPSINSARCLWGLTDEEEESLKKAVEALALPKRVLPEPIKPTKLVSKNNGSMVCYKYQMPVHAVSTGSGVSIKTN